MRLEKYFGQEPNSKDFSLCGPHMVFILPIQFCHCRVKAAIDKSPNE